MPREDRAVWRALSDQNVSIKKWKQLIVTEESRNPLSKLISDKSICN
jgi:hypothetical protein